MITITKVEATDRIDADYVLCPSCKRRLCDKMKGAKTSILQLSEYRKPFESLLIKCGKCGNRYLISTETEIE